MVGINRHAVNCTPSGTSVWQSASASHQGAPIMAKGASVPRPTLTFVASNRHVPGYQTLLSKRGMAGEVGTHWIPVAGHARVASHPSQAITSNGTDGACSDCHTRANSPNDRLWRTGMSSSPMNDWQEASRMGPSAAASTPPNGLGRSSTTSGTAASAQAWTR